MTQPLTVPGLKIYDASSIPAKPVHCFVYGPMGSGKTFFAGTWPNPIFLSAGQEGGDTTLRMCFHDRQFTVIEIPSSQALETAVTVIGAQHARYGWKTVVLDSTTFYADTYIAERRVAAGVKFGQQDWGLLEFHLMKWLLPAMRKLPLHVVWVALDRFVKDEDTGAILQVEPMLPGQNARRFPAACDLTLYAEQIRVPGPAVNGKPGPTSLQRVLWTRPPNPALSPVTLGKAAARTRFENVIPEPYLPNDFAYFRERIGPWIGEG